MMMSFLVKLPLSAKYWLKDDFQVYQLPYVIGTQEEQTDLTAYQAVTVYKKATTHHGTYYKVDGKSWISEEALSSTGNRMEKSSADFSIRNTIKVTIPSLR